MWQVFLFLLLLHQLSSKNIDLAINKKLAILILIFALIISFAFSPDMKFWVIGASNTLSAITYIIVNFMVYFFNSSKIITRYFRSKKNGIVFSKDI